MINKAKLKYLLTLSAIAMDFLTDSIGKYHAAFSISIYKLIVKSGLIGAFFSITLRVVLPKEKNRRD
jgi:hypothetical protein